ncbi:MAG TPA: hypothetical protein VI122_00460 [Thermoleophilaceae bacterium]
MLPAVKGDSDVPMRTKGSISLVRNLVAARTRGPTAPDGLPVDLWSAGRDHIFGEGALERFELEQTRVLDGRVVSFEYQTIK